jgi:hypothetical protein
MQQVQRERWSAAEPRRPLVVLVVVGVVVVLAVVAALGVVVVSSGNRAERSSATERQVDDDSRSAGSVEMRSVEDPSRVQRAASWLNGLASGQILPTDVTGRLQQQDEQLARLVMGTWRRLERP